MKQVYISVNPGTDEDIDEIVEVLEPYLEKNGYKIKMDFSNSYHEIKRFHTSNLKQELNVSVVFELEKK